MINLNYTCILKSDMRVIFEYTNFDKKSIDRGSHNEKVTDENNII